ncbi:alpha-glucuronidase family glycosyl hydrolase [Aquisalinus flavus]|uniref:Xylan alpha-1,2-glucuronidase n=1 Tax=Aquisalinus flavus TaxID=1526572 RepID=A0A8J2V1H1_9PROT|nr:alpha-glucuronidase family glycosyl hydrolase [Aquisalinus flavus]MBD0427153.1 alpha-glucuronidase [Aquisalinus flavus]UNE46972.1 alpha-glucuronidase [Aquisalinus flavus]GGC98777.1 xylan alpha-1,2-glucuronidase [Aquisalinus flavus]
MKHPKALLAALTALISLALAGPNAQAEDGYDLWLRYEQASEDLRPDYRKQISAIAILGDSPTIAAARQEMATGLAGILDKTVTVGTSVPRGNTLVAGTYDALSDLDLDRADVGPEGYAITQMRRDGRILTIIAADSDIGVLYGTFGLLQHMLQGEPIAGIDLVSRPATQHRLLNHWDNLDRYVERGYAGQSLWDWHKLPDYRDPRYTDYARANAAIGVNGTSLTNVNANAEVLTPQYLEKAAPLADVFRPYGIKVYLTARFSAPIEIGGLDTADPSNEEVQAWWEAKAEEIYNYIPDFGGFLVKANSEGQPGPQDYDRNHADGANMLADAVAPHGGIVMWRAFVYAADETQDRAKQAWEEFVPFDGQFRDNVLIQVKNGPIDFQPREPFSPLFAGVEDTKLMMEFQITKEYLGFATHLAYLGTMWEETLDAPAQRTEEGETLTVTDMMVSGNDAYTVSGMAGVANIGTDRNWSGSIFDQANWYAFGRLAWDPALDAETVAREWAAMTFTPDRAFLDPVVAMMMGSREAVVDYMTPLGLHHLMDTGHHYGPGPWVDDLDRPDWNPAYYHKADEDGIGFDRSSSGSDAVSQYAGFLREEWDDPETTPDELLLWFHHLSWDYEMRSGRTLWEEIVHHYQRGVDEVEAMRETWDGMAPYVDAERHAQIADFLAIQEKEARWWRNACLAYFMEVSGRDLPDGYEAPPHDVDHYKSLYFPSAPGNG